VIEARDYIPRAYGPPVVEFMYKTPKCALYAPPGFGKTAMVYTLLDHLLLAGSGFFPALVIAPKMVCDLTWPKEVQKWKQFAHIRVSKVLGTPAERADALIREADVYVINFDNLPWLVERMGEHWPFRIIVIDESTRIKGFRLKKGRKRAHLLSTVIEKAGRVIELSGTPAPNGLRDLWGQLYFVDKGARLGHSYGAFMDRWFTVSQYDNSVKPRPHAEKEIYAAISDITLALRPEDWFDIDEPIEIQREVTLPPDAMKQYEKMEKEFFLEIGDSEIDALNAMALSQKLLQIASGSMYDNEKNVHLIHEAKLDMLESIIEESGGESILVAYHYQFEVEMLRKRFPNIVMFKGVKEQDAWNRGEIALMAAHPMSAGHGIDLQDGGRILVFLTQTWNLEYRLQIIERIGSVRQLQSGNPRAVLIYDIIASGTIDEEVLAAAEGKLTVQQSLMAARALRQ
jgi:SNF2 family DNA or RNA helicase